MPGGWRPPGFARETAACIVRGEQRRWDPSQKVLCSFTLEHHIIRAQPPGKGKCEISGSVERSIQIARTGGRVQITRAEGILEQCREAVAVAVFGGDSIEGKRVGAAGS